MKDQTKPNTNFSGDEANILSQMALFEVDDDRLDIEGISELIEALFQKLGSEDVGNIVANAVNSRIFSLEQGRKFLEISMWSGSTNGAQLNSTLEMWLEEGNDPVRIDLALHQGIFPFSDKEKMSGFFSKIKNRYPQFSDFINEKIKRRDIQGV